MFKNEYERQLAIAKGFDASLPPEQASMVQALKQQDARQAAALAAYRDKAFPVDPTMNPEQWVQNVINGDTTGFAKDFLVRQAGYDPTYAVELGAGMQQRDGELPLNKFYGRNQITPKGTFVAEEAVTDDPAFRKLMARDPAAAAVTYRRLVGRELGTDMPAKNYALLQDLQKKNEAEDQSKMIETAKLRTVLEGLLSGEDEYDPQTLKWLTQGRVDTGEVDLNGKPVFANMQVPASETKSDALTKYFTQVTGKELPVGDFRRSKELEATLSPKQGGLLESLGIKPVTADDPELLQALQIRKRQLGKPSLTPSEQLEVVSLIERQRLSTKKESWWTSFRSGGEQAIGSVGDLLDTMWGRKFTEGLAIPEPIIIDNDETRKFWGYGK